MYKKSKRLANARLTRKDMSDNAKIERKRIMNQVKMQENEMNKKGENNMKKSVKENRREICVWIEKADEKGRKKVEKVRVWVKEDKRRTRDGMERMYVWIEGKEKREEEKKEVCVWIEKEEQKQEENAKSKINEYIENAEAIQAIPEKQENVKENNGKEREDSVKRGQQNIYKWTEKEESRRKRKEKKKTMETEQDNKRKEEATIQAGLNKERGKETEEINQKLEGIPIIQKGREGEAGNWKRKERNKAIKEKEIAKDLEAIAFDRKQRLNTGQENRCFLAEGNERGREIWCFVRLDKGKEKNNIILGRKAAKRERKLERDIFVRENRIEKGSKDRRKTAAGMGEEKWIGWRRERKKSNYGRAGFW